MTTQYDPAAFTVAYAWVRPGMIAAQLRISLTAVPGGKTHTHIRYLYTGLSPTGSTELERRYTPQWFREKMQAWETAINHYLRTGQLLETTALAQAGPRAPRFLILTSAQSKIKDTEALPWTN